MNKTIKTILLASAMLSIAGTASACENSQKLPAFQQAFLPLDTHLTVNPSDNMLKAIYSAEKLPPLENVATVLSMQNPGNNLKLSFNFFNSDDCHIANYSVSKYKYMIAFLKLIANQ